MIPASILVLTPIVYFSHLIGFFIPQFYIVQYLVFLIWKMFHTHRYNILCVNAVPGHIPLENWFSLILAEQLLLSSVLNLESFHATLWRLSQVVHFKNIFYWLVNFYYFLWLIGVSFSKNVLLIHAFFTMLCPLASSSIYFAK